MIPAKGFAGKTIVVYGLGRSGLAGVRSLLAGNAHVIAWDDLPEKRDVAKDLDADIQDLRKIDWQKVDGLLLSPGIPHKYPKPNLHVIQALEAGVPMLSDIDILYESQIHCVFIGVSGTNGKSTTTALINHLLKTAGKKVQMGGNIGVAALDLDPYPETSPGIYVLELSSFQLDHIQKTTFESAVILNIESDHLNRHGGMDGYVKAKQKLFDRVKISKVISGDYEPCLKIIEKEKKKEPEKLIVVSCHHSSEISGFQGHIIDTHLPNFDVAELLGTNLEAFHNWENAVAAYAATKFMNLTLEKIHDGVKTFPGLEHRQEAFLTTDTCLFINDSKATNIASTKTALEAFYDKSISRWILGGRSKGGDFSQFFHYADKIKKTYVYGEARLEIETALKPKFNVATFETLEQATKQAYEDMIADPDPHKCILFSPACASFDQFKDFEERGRTFKSIVKELVK